MSTAAENPLTRRAHRHAPMAPLYAVSWIDTVAAWLLVFLDTRPWRTATAD